MTLLAVDPGKMTGWAMWDPERGYFRSAEDHWFGFLRTFEERAATDPQMQVVCESFIINQATLRKSREHWSLEAIGAMKYILAREELPDMVLQTPAAGKKFGTDAKLKAMGWWNPGNPHANDAARHLLTYVAGKPMWGVDLTPLIEDMT